jgi:hypothetical protein
MSLKVIKLQCAAAQCEAQGFLGLAKVYAKLAAQALKAGL